MITMLEAQLLPKRIIRIYEEGDSIVQASFRKGTEDRRFPQIKKNLYLEPSIIHNFYLYL